MHVLDHVITLTVIAVAAASPCSSVTHTIATGPLDRLEEDNEEYLLIDNARRFCDGGSILEADCEVCLKESTFIGTQSPLEDALDACKNTQECSFLCHTVKKSYPSSSFGVPDIADSSTVVPKSSATWLCSGQGWMRLYPKNGWMTAIKGSVVRDLCKPFTVWLNQTAECSRSNTLDVARDLTPRQAVLLCKSIPECTFFTMSLQSHDSELAFVPLAHFCKGTPTKRVARDGHFLATSPVLEETMQKTGSISGRHSPKIAYYFGGPLTNDAYYDDKTPGSLVPATRL